MDLLGGGVKNYRSSPGGWIVEMLEFALHFLISCTCCSEGKRVIILRMKLLFNVICFLYLKLQLCHSWKWWIKQWSSIKYNGTPLILFDRKYWCHSLQNEPIFYNQHGQPISAQEAGYSDQAFDPYLQEEEEEEFARWEAGELEEGGHWVEGGDYQAWSDQDEYFQT